MKIFSGCGKNNFQVEFGLIYFSRYGKSYIDSMCKRCRQEYKNSWARSSEKSKICQKRWRSSEKAKICQERYKSKTGAKQKRNEYQNEYQKTYRLTEIGKRIELRYRKSIKRKQTVKRWLQTETGKLYRKLNNKRWLSSEKGRTASKKHTVKRRSLKYRNTNFSIMLTNEQWRELLGLFNFSCAYCGKDIHVDPTQDHVIPLSKGGLHSIDNIVPACRQCNSSKHDKIWEPNRQWIN